eukprot:6175445-Pyramimonas_sp.AAC.1
MGPRAARSESKFFHVPTVADKGDVGDRIVLRAFAIISEKIRSRVNSPDFKQHDAEQHGQDALDYEPSSRRHKSLHSTTLHW